MIHRNAHEITVHVTGRGAASSRRELLQAIEEALRDEETRVYPGDYLVIIMRRETGRR